MMWNGYEYGCGAFGGYWLLSIIFSVLFWALVIGALVMFVRWFAKEPGMKFGANDRMPLDLLRERYAKGEITRHEFEEIRKDLASTKPEEETKR